MFLYGQRIVLEAGTKSIGKLFKHNFKIQTYNELEKKFEYVYPKVTMQTGKLVELRFGNRKVQTIKDTLFLTQKGWKKVYQLNIGDAVLTNNQCVNQILKELNDDQYQVVLGSYLGDGSLQNVGLNRFRLREIHGMKQREYSLWKSNLFNCKNKTIDNNGYAKNQGVYFSTCVFVLNSDKINKNNCPQWVLDDIDARGICVWFLDDGSVSKDKNHAVISTCSFDDDSHVRMKNMFKDKFDIDVTIFESCGYKYLRLNKYNYGKLNDLIHYYAHDSMNYKIFNKINNYNWDNKFKNNLVVLDKIIDLYKLEDLYCIENCNYVVCSSSRDKKQFNKSGIIVKNI